MEQFLTAMLSERQQNTLRDKAPPRSGTPLDLHLIKQGMEVLAKLYYIVCQVEQRLFFNL